MKKVLFLFYGSMYVIEQIEGLKSLEEQLTPDMSENEALGVANKIIIETLDIETEYNLNVVKMTFQAGAADKEIENYIDGFVKGSHFEDYDGSGNAQDCCTFILKEKANEIAPVKKKAVIISFTIQTRKIIEIPDGTDLDAMTGEDIANIARMARSHILVDASDYLCPDNMSILVDDEVPAQENEPVNYKLMEPQSHK